MAFPWAAAIGAVAGLFGSKQSAKAASSEAQINRDFQEEMSRTSHQREVQDLIASGLNPMLSAKLGGASTPSGSVAPVPDYGSAISQGALSGSNSAKSKAEIELIKSQTSTQLTQAALNETLASKAAAEASAAQANAQTISWNLAKSQWLEDKHDAWFVEGKELDARMLKADYERAKSSNDYNTLKFLNEFATKEGYRNFDEAVSRQSFRASLQAYFRSSLAIPKEQAESDFYKTLFGREVAPMLNSANSAVGLGAGTLSIGRRLLQK